MHNLTIAREKGILRGRDMQMVDQARQQTAACEKKQEKEVGGGGISQD